MLRVGVTGGIGSGKSTLSSLLRARGAHVIDADQLAREVLAPGSPGLAEVIAHFGPDLLRSGQLDRAALAAVVFADPTALEILERITHPRVRARFEEEVRALPSDAVVVHEVPLLAEKSLEDQYHLVIGLTVDDHVRRQRLMERGMDAGEIERRMAHQFSDSERARHCDVIITNDGDQADLADAIAPVWERIALFAENIAAGLPAVREAALHLVAHDPRWSDQAARLIARLHRELGEVEIRHIGSTAVPGLIAKDVIDLQVSVTDLDAVPVDAYLAAGFAAHPTIDSDLPRPSQPDPAEWRKRFFQSCDPGRPVNLHVRPIGSAGERYARLFPAWLAGDPQACAEYAALKSTLSATLTTTSDYAAAKEPWFHQQEARMLAWAAATGWD